MPLESIFKRRLIARIKELYPGAIILKNDANHIQGFPDQLILYDDRWAAFEAKKDRSSPYQTNQEYWVKTLNDMSFARFVYPQNQEAFLDELQQALRPSRRARISVRF